MTARELRTKQQCGFTLVELLTTLILITILMVYAIASASDTSKAARAASVQAMAGVTHSVANLAHMKWATMGTSASTVAITLSNGSTVFTFNGYPDAGNCCASPGIEALIDSAGFTISTPDNSHTRWSISTAQDPTRCQVNLCRSPDAGINLSGGC
jgi:prepilin-type N-terminal cleavage/methylation domain-containing protein